MGTENKQKKSYFKLNLIIIIFALLVCIASIPFAIIQIGRRQLDIQLDNAAAQGIPTTVEDLKKLYDTFPPEQNGIEVCREAEKAYVKLNYDDIAASTIINGNYLTYQSAKKCPEIDKYLKSNEDTASLIDQLVNYRVVRQTQNWNEVFGLSSCGLFTRFAQLSKIRCFQTIKNNNPALAYKMIDNESKIRDIALYEPIPLSIIITAAIESIRMRLLEDVVNNVHLYNKTLLTEIQKLDKLDKQLPEIWRKICLFETGHYTVYFIKKPYFTEFRWNTFFPYWLLRRMFYNHDSAKFLELMIQIINLHPQDYYKNKGIITNKMVTSMNLPRYYDLGHCIYPFLKTTLKVAVVRGYLRMAKCGLAAELYRRKYGDYPDKLEQLVPEFLDKIPINPVNGNPFHYFKGNYDYHFQTIPPKSNTSKKPGMLFGPFIQANDAKKHVNGCYIYSEGKNGIDKGGNPGGTPDRYGRRNTFALIRPQKKTDKKQGNKAK